MKSNKGFTLVELLAIIVILGIIAVITTPVILGVIDDARKDAAADKAWGTIDAIKFAYANEKITQGSNLDITDYIAGDNKVVRISGEKPTAGTFTITDDGDVTVTNFTFGDYKCSNTADMSKMVCTK